MNRYNDLECSVLCCLLIKPELMEQTILEDKYFTKYKKLWIFMKAYYTKFKNFDITLMASVINDKWKLMRYIMDVLETEPSSKRFFEYEQRLIEIYNQAKKDKWLTNKIYYLTNDLIVGNITTEQFKNKINEIYKSSNEIF